MKLVVIGTLLCLLVTCFGNFALAQGTSATYKDRDQAESNTGAFNPSDLLPGEAKHLAVFFDIVDGKLVLSSRVAEVMYGNMPYKSRTGGQFAVIAKDSAGKELYRYYTSDIRMIRAFDGEEKETTFIKHAKDMMIRIPYDSNIYQLEIGSTIIEGDMKTYDIRGVVEKVVTKMRK